MVPQELTIAIIAHHLTRLLGPSGMHEKKNSLTKILQTRNRYENCRLEGLNKLLNFILNLQCPQLLSNEP